MTDAGTRTVKVWDPIVRLFHWSLVLAFAIAWASGDEWDQLHEIVGFAILGLVALRLLWGVAGPRYARFWQFVRSPREVIIYLRALFTGRERRYLGHNPAGGAMVVSLLMMLVATGTTGWMMSLDVFWGTEWVEETHEVLATLLLIMVGLHLAGVLLASVRHGENLVKSMLNGRKRIAASGDVA